VRRILKTSLFITFEGIEGCGKSTQSQLLYRRLFKLAIPVLLTHEPGITPLGNKITRMLKWAKDLDISPLSELFLFSASRAEHLSQIVLPALKEGKVVICDRFTDSTAAYQGYGRGIDLSTIFQINQYAADGLVPDLTILLDMPSDAGLARKRDDKPDRFHTESIAFHHRVRDGFLKLSAEEPKRWFIIDGTQSKDEIAAVIWEKVTSLIANIK
jgi:dTMP kinase